MASASELEIEFLRRYQSLAGKGPDIRRIYEERLAKVLGKGGASAAMFYFGDDCANPTTFLEKLKILFKGGTEVLLLNLIDQDSVEGRPA